MTNEDFKGFEELAKMSNEELEKALVDKTDEEKQNASYFRTGYQLAVFHLENGVNSVIKGLKCY